MDIFDRVLLKAQSQSGWTIEKEMKANRLHRAAMISGKTCRCKNCKDARRFEKKLKKSLPY